MTTTHKLGKGRIEIEGQPVAEIKDIRLPSTGPAFTHHCLSRKMRRVTPHATFRRWANEGTSYFVLLSNIDEQEQIARVRLAEALTTNARVMAELDHTAGKSATIVDRFGRALQGK